MFTKISQTLVEHQFRK